MQRAVLASSALASLLLLCLLVLLGVQERGGPAHHSFELEGGTPATLTMPGEGGDSGFAMPADPPAHDGRPPAIVLTHGFASDRAVMSTLARRLAAAGYAVLSIDVAGHGANRNPLMRGAGGGNDFHRDLSAAVTWLRRSQHVDGRRIVVMGHSMGASASLAYATRDSGIDGAVMISSGKSLPGPHRPPNALFIYAEDDPERIHVRSAELAARLAGVDALAEGQVAGRFANGTAVAHERVPGVDHITIVLSENTTRRIVSWLDRIYGFERSSQLLQTDPRLTTAGLALLALLLVLPGLGLAVGHIAPPAQASDESSPALELALFALSLLIALPFIAAGSPFPLISLELADLVVVHLAIAGCIALAIALGRQRSGLGQLASELRAALGPALLVLIAIGLLMTPIGVVGHRLALTPERTFAALLCAFLLVPYALALHWRLRRGPVWRASALALAGRLAVLIVIYLGVEVGVLPRVTMLMLPILAALQLFFELLCTGIYAARGNRVLCALIEAGWLAWILAAVLPIRL
jgi:dienelactone hydrolase